MKKTLVTGVGLIIIIFMLSGVVIMDRIGKLTSIENMRDRHENIINQYQNIMLNMESAQTELYRHQAGYTRNIDNMVENVLRIEDAVIRFKGEYEPYVREDVCNICHNARVKFETLQTRLDEAVDHLHKYENKVSFLITLRDKEISNSVEKEAIREGDEVLDIIAEAVSASTLMTGQMDKIQTASLRDARIFIVGTIVLSAVISVIVVILIITEMRKPLFKLVEAIKKVSQGQYDSKVDIVSDDEIGYLAKTFNTMTDNLKEMTREKTMLLDELRQINSNLEDRVLKATEELKLTHKQILRTETLSAVGIFASGVAHELATPLSSIISYVQMIKKRSRDADPFSGEMDLVEKELVRCRNILRGMLAFARAPEKEQRPTDINSILKDLLALIKYQAKYKTVSIKENLSPSLPSVIAVTGQLRQVFMNLIMNALQSMPDGGELEVETFAGEDRVGIRIADTGSGIASDVIERIFQPFYTGKEGGTGLGLSISYGIVKAHGGDIEVISEEGKGSTFSVYFPVVNEGGQAGEGVDIKSGKLDAHEA